MSPFDVPSQFAVLPLIDQFEFLFQSLSVAKSPFVTSSLPSCEKLPLETSSVPICEKLPFETNSWTNYLYILY